MWCRAPVLAKFPSTHRGVLLEVSNAAPTNGRRAPYGRSNVAQAVHQQDHIANRACNRAFDSPIIRAIDWGEELNPLSPPEPGGLVRRGLSAAGGAYGFIELALAAVKR